MASSSNRSVSPARVDVASDTSVPPPPAQIDEYEIIRPLGRGATGQVYQALDTVLGRSVAVKVLASAQPSQASCNRFLIEARAIARLQHPNVLAIHRVGVIDGRPYLVEEFLRGESLDQIPLPLSWQRVLDIAVQLARGLAAAHRQGVLHRDIKKILMFGGFPLVLACSPAAEEACGAGDSASPSCVQNRRQEGRSWQGRSWQGRSWQGRSWQGRSWQGTDAAVSTIQAVRLGGSTVENLQLTGTLLSGTVGGQGVAGADFVGATVLQRDPDGVSTETTITAVQADPADPEILLYTLTAYDPSAGSQQNLCDPDPWGGQYATVVRGSWTFSGDHVNVETDLMFACTSGVVAKCARWGYKPWKTVSGRSLADYHQACTRMARADYCGDGVTHTEDGTLIDLYDDLGIQVRSGFSLTSPLIFDAAWTTAGAYCMTKDRWLKLSSLASVTLDCKSRFLSLFPLLESSPVDSRDLCGVKRGDVSRSAVHIDNQSGLNISLY